MKKSAAGFRHIITGLALAALLPVTAPASQTAWDEPEESLTEELTEAVSEEEFNEAASEEELTGAASEETLTAAERLVKDPAGFILEEMSDVCFASFYDEDLVCFGEVPGEDLAVLGISVNGETSLYGGAFTLEDNHVTITDASGAGKITFDVGSSSECPFVIMTGDDGSKSYEMWPASSGMLAAQAKRARGSLREMTFDELDAVCGEDPLYGLLSGIDKAWEKEEVDGGDMIYGLSADGEFACRVSIRPDGEILLRTGKSSSLPKPPGDLVETDPLLPGRMMLYTGKYLGYIIDANEMQEETEEEIQEEMSEAP